MHGPGELGSTSAVLIELFHAVAEAATIGVVLGVWALARPAAGRLMALGSVLSAVALALLAVITVVVTAANGLVGEAVATPIFAVGLLGMAFGLPLVGAAAWRARLRPRWLPPLLMAHPVFFFFLLQSYTFGALALGLLWLLVGIAMRLGRSRPAAPAAVAAGGSSH